MSELAYTLLDSNAHYGQPRNPAARHRHTGGSSSGTAAAVAAGDADIGLGGDTAGSVRLPASYCGIFGMRPTHGRISLQNSVPLAPSFDTAGWFTRDVSLLRKVGEVLLDPMSRRPTFFKRWLVGSDAFEIAQDSTSRAVYSPLAKKIDQIISLIGSTPEEVVIGSIENGLSKGWIETLRITQAYEVWQEHGEWITKERPALGPGIKERFEMASKVSEDEFKAAQKSRSKIIEHMGNVVGEDGLLIIPTTPGPAPELATHQAELDAMRTSLVSLTCIASLAHLPQVTIPIGLVDGAPIGLGVLGPAGSDEDLLRFSEDLVHILSLPNH